VVFSDQATPNFYAGLIAIVGVVSEGLLHCTAVS